MQFEAGHIIISEYIKTIYERIYNKCDEEEEYLSCTVRENGSWAVRLFQEAEREGSFGAV